MTILLIESIPGYKQSLIDYCKSKYDISIRDLTITFLADLPYFNDSYQITNIDGPIISSYWSLKDEPQVTHVSDIADVSTVGDILASEFISPTVSWTDDLVTAKRWLSNVDSKFDIITCDFEAHNLAIPQFNDLTMLSISWSFLKSIVIVFSDPNIKDHVLDWLVTTNTRQIWHNA